MASRSVVCWVKALDKLLVKLCRVCCGRQTFAPTGRRASCTCQGCLIRLQLLRPLIPGKWRQQWSVRCAER